MSIADDRANRLFLRHLAERALRKGEFYACRDLSTKLVHAARIVSPPYGDEIPSGNVVLMRGRLLLLPNTEQTAVREKSEETFTTSDNVVYKVRFMPGDRGMLANNSILVEDVVHEFDLNPMLLSNQTPNLELSLGVMRCTYADFFGAIDADDTELQRLNAALIGTARGKWMLDLPDCSRIDVLALVKPKTAIPFRTYFNSSLRNPQRLQQTLVMFIFQVAWTLDVFRRRGHLVHNDMTIDNMTVEVLPVARTFRYVTPRGGDVIYRTKVLLRIVNFEHANSDTVDRVLNGNSLLRGSTLESIPISEVCGVAVPGSRLENRVGECGAYGQCDAWNPWSDWVAFLTSLEQLASLANISIPAIDGFLGPTLRGAAAKFPKPFILCGSPDPEGPVGRCGPWSGADFAAFGFQGGTAPPTPTELLSSGRLVDFVRVYGSADGQRVFRRDQVDPDFSGEQEIMAANSTSTFFSMLLNIVGADELSPEERVTFPKPIG